MFEIPEQFLYLYMHIKFSRFCQKSILHFQSRKVQTSCVHASLGGEGSRNFEQCQNLVGFSLWLPLANIFFLFYSILLRRICKKCLYLLTETFKRIPKNGPYHIINHICGHFGPGHNGYFGQFWQFLTIWR